jgi:hypothetical protein
VAHEHFDGETYEEEHDEERLSKQIIRVRSLMLDGQWRTLAEISAITGDPQASISARLRDLRKVKFGSYIIGRRRRGLAKHGIHEYQLQGSCGMDRCHADATADATPRKPTARQLSLALEDLHGLAVLAKEQGYEYKHPSQVRRLGEWLKHLAGKVGGQ